MSDPRADMDILLANDPRSLATAKDGGSSSNAGAVSEIGESDGGGRIAPGAAIEPQYIEAYATN